GFAALAIAMPMRNDVADQVAAVHALSKLQLDIVAGADFDALQIRVDRRIVARLDQVLLRDQLGDLWTFNDGVEDAAEPATIATTWCSSQPDQHRVGVSGNDPAISAG